MPPTSENSDSNSEILEKLEPRVKSSIAANVKAALQEDAPLGIDISRMIYHVQIHLRKEFPVAVDYHALIAVMDEMKSKGVIDYDDYEGMLAKISLVD